MTKFAQLNNRLLQLVARRFRGRSQEIRKALLLTSLGSLVLLYSAIFTVYYASVGLPIGAIICCYAMASVGMMALLMFRYRKVNTAGHFFCGTTIVFFALSMWFTNGIESPFTHWLIIAPVTASMLFDWRETASWAAMAILAMLLFYGFNDLVPDRPRNFFLSRESAVSVISYLGFFIYCIGIILILEKNKSDLHALERLRKVERKNSRMAMQEWLSGQEMERARIARDLHDGLSGMVTAVRLRHQAARKNSDPHGKFLVTLDRIGQVISTISRRLSTHELRDFGLAKSLANLADLFQEKSGVEIELMTSGLDDLGFEELELHIYRIVQESLENIRLHAEAKEVVVQVLKLDAMVRILIEDNGKGMAPEQREEEVGNGLREIRNRVEAMQGEFIIDTSPGRGVTLIAEIPLLHENDTPSTGR